MDERLDPLKARPSAVDDRSCSTGDRCLWCGRASRRVFVHGHVQCGHCGLNIDPCCGGETAESS